MNIIWMNINVVAVIFSERATVLLVQFSSFISMPCLKWLLSILDIICRFKTVGADFGFLLS